MQCKNPNCNNPVELRKNGKTYKTYCSAECRNKYSSVLAANTRISKRSAAWMGSDTCSLPGCSNPSLITLKGKYSSYCSPECRKKGVVSTIKKTNLKKYGVENASTLPAVKEKIRHTFDEKYGGHPMTNESVLSKISNTYSNKYTSKWIGNLSAFFSGTDETDLIEQYRQYAADKSVQELANALNLSNKVILESLYRFDVRTQIPFRSSFEQDIANILDRESIQYVCNSRSQIYPKELDIFIPSYNLAIECNGNFWHTELQGKDKQYHIFKTTECKKKGIDLIHIWEYEWVMSPKILESIILNRLGKSSKLYARKCTIGPVSTAIEREFLTNNHIQGYCPSSSCIGLYHNNTLVSLMSFGKSRYAKNKVELLRFSNLVGLTVVGAASRLFKHYTTYNSVSEIISYSHKDKFSGNLYKSLGFSFSHTSLPSYRYTRDYLHFENRLKYQKHKLSKVLLKFDSSLSEWENMKNNGYDRIWDCGNDVWVWTR